MTLTGLLPGRCSGLSGEQVGSVSAPALLSDRPHSLKYITLGVAQCKLKLITPSCLVPSSNSSSLSLLARTFPSFLIASRINACDLLFCLSNKYVGQPPDQMRLTSTRGRHTHTTTLHMTLLPEMTPPKTALQCSCNDRWYPTRRGCHRERKDGIKRAEGRVTGIDFW